jgi:type III secretion system YseE family protein
MARLTRLEDSLLRDVDGAARAAHLACLDAAQAQLLRALRLPQTPQAHEALQCQLAACRAAAGIVITLWRRYHPL